MSKKDKKQPARKGTIREQLDNAREVFAESWESVYNAKLPHILVVIVVFAVIVAFVMGFAIERDSDMFPDSGGSFWVRLVDSFYFALVTLSTVGYGDYSPKTIPGKLIDLVFIISGVLCFSLLTATLASIRVAKMIREDVSKVELSALKGHTVICGWKKTMEQNLDDLFRLNPDLAAPQIVVIANISQDAIDLFKSNYPKFKDVNFVRSEDYTENVLLSVNIRGARKAFILADESTDSSLTEKDSRTVMTAMTISNIAKNLHICAELLDPKFETYLEQAHVAEIIYPRQYGRLVLAHSAHSTGFVQVMNSLLDLNTSTSIRTLSFPDQFVGKPFSELRQHFSKEHGAIIIGLVENVGSYFERKQEALREAQKTANISKIVENLQIVKNMKNNHPVFNLPDDYEVPDNSIGIIVVTNEPEAKEAPEGEKSNG